MKAHTDQFRLSSGKPFLPPDKEQSEGSCAHPIHKARLIQSSWEGPASRAVAKHPPPPHPSTHRAGSQAGYEGRTLEAMMNKEDSGFRAASVLATWVPSMLETNQTRGPSEEYGLRASVTMRGPCGKTQHQKTRFQGPREVRTARSHLRRNQGPGWDPSSPIPRQPLPYQVRAADADVDDIRDGLA